MPSSYRVNIIPHVVNQTINRALTHFCKRFAMMRHPERPQATSTKPCPVVPPSVAIEDWDALFSAVKARLTLIGQPQNAACAEPPTANALELVRASVLECVQALDQLHATARQELAGRDKGGKGDNGGRGDE